MIQCFAPAVELPDMNTFFDMRLISASKMDFEFKSIHPRLLHKHAAFLEILFVRNGKGVYSVNEERYSVSKGDVIINNANTLHDEEPNNSNNLNMYGITVSNLQIRSFPPNTLIPPDTSPVFSAEEYADYIESIMDMIYTMLATEPEAHIKGCHYLTMALLSQLQLLIDRRVKQTGQAPRSKQDIVSMKIKNYIDSHYDEHFTLEDISRELYISPYYLSHIFKKTVGFSPMHYTIRRRLGEAQSLLIMTDKSITEIALSIGFGSQCQFYSMFKKYIGMSPGKYRETYGHNKEKPSGK